MWLQGNTLSGSLTNISSVCVWDIASDVPSSFLPLIFYFLHAGSIPETIGQLQSLTTLRLSNNQLSGAFTNISSGVWDVASDVPF